MYSTISVNVFLFVHLNLNHQKHKTRDRVFSIRKAAEVILNIKYPQQTNRLLYYVVVLLCYLNTGN